MKFYFIQNLNQVSIFKHLIKLKEKRFTSISGFLILKKRRSIRLVPFDRLTLKATKSQETSETFANQNLITKINEKQKIQNIWKINKIWNIFFLIQRFSMEHYFHATPNMCQSWIVNGLAPLAWMVGQLSIQTKDAFQLNQRCFLETCCCCCFYERNQAWILF